MGEALNYRAILKALPKLREADKRMEETALISVGGRDVAVYLGPKDTRQLSFDFGEKAR